MRSHSGKIIKEEGYCTARNEKVSGNEEMNLSFYTKTAFLLSNPISKTMVD